MSKLNECKNNFEQTIKGNIGLIKYFKKFYDSHMNNSLSGKILFNNSVSYDDSTFELIKNTNNSLNVTKIISFCKMISFDINNLIEIVKNKNLNLINEFFTIKQSLMFYRPVQLQDERFLDDII